MAENHDFDVIIIGGSYSGLAAGMALGRALKKVLIIDEGKPCNRQTPHSHNFLTNDGKTPKEIAQVAKQQVAKYNTIHFFDGTATGGRGVNDVFEIQVSSGETFKGRKIIFATGIVDLLAPIDGLAERWGISVIHCPYCHGYEVRNEKTGVLGNGEQGYEMIKLIFNWTKELTLLTNGASTLTLEQASQLRRHGINIEEKEIKRLDEVDGVLQQVIFIDGSTFSLKALYAPAPFRQHCTIPETLGCEFTEEGYIKVDAFQETTVPGIFACGDNTTRMRTVANAVLMGTTAGITASKKMILEDFE